VLTSVEVLYLGQLHRGTTHAESFYLHDRGDLTLRIEDLNAAVDKTAASAEHIVCDAASTHLRTDNIPRNALSRYRVKPGDYLINLTLKISPDTPFGPFEGKVHIETNQPGRHKSGIVEFKGTIISDVYAEPPALLLSRREPAARIELKSKLHKKVEMPQLPPTVSADAGLRIERLDDSGGSVAYNVSVQDFNDAGVRNAKISFNIDDKSSVTVPVVIYDAPQ
jgi:hypothetical protein